MDRPPETPPVFDKLSYLAGILDGEGHIAVEQFTVRLENGRTKKKRRFVLVVKMTSENLIDWLHENFGGLKSFHRSKNPRWKDQWRWRLSGGKARALYERVQPLLKIKNNIDTRTDFRTPSQDAR